jgi:hypothetical protein
MTGAELSVNTNPQGHSAAEAEPLAEPRPPREGNMPTSEDQPSRDDWEEMQLAERSAGLAAIIATMAGTTRRLAAEVTEDGLYALDLEPVAGFLEVLAAYVVEKGADFDDVDCDLMLCIPGAFTVVLNELGGALTRLGAADLVDDINRLRLVEAAGETTSDSPTILH